MALKGRKPLVAAAAAAAAAEGTPCRALLSGVRNTQQYLKGRSGTFTLSRNSAPSPNPCREQVSLRESRLAGQDTAL